MSSLSLAHEFVGFAAADAMRRWYGLALDLWLRRKESPYRIVLERPGVRLRQYGSGGVPLLIVPAPIKQPYLWDLTPSASVVQRCLEAGFGVYVMEWTERPPEDDAGIAVYADRLMLDCAERIGDPVVLMGHSLGGTFSAIFASLHPAPVRGLVLLEAPLSFTDDTGALAALIRMVPRSAPLQAAHDYPGTLLNALSVIASPESFWWWRWRDSIASLHDAAALRTHLLVERWTLDEHAMPADLVADIVSLYRDDRFMRGTLVGEKTALAKNVRAPVFAVIDPESKLVPPSSVVPFLDALPDHNWTIAHYEGDIGISLRHVGVLVGRNAHRHLWPEIIDWIRSLE